MKNCNLVLLLTLILILILIIIIFLDTFVKNKKENFEDDIFYTSKLRLMDYQDILSTTESQIIKNTF